MEVAYRTAAVPARATATTGVALGVSDVVKGFEGSKSGSWWQRARGQAPASSRVMAVDHVSFEVRRNEVFGILGPNGSGKSTLIRLISTLLIPDSGQITVFGYDVQRDERIVKRMINRVSVDAAFFKKLSPMENLLYAGRLYGLDGRSIREQSTAILNRFGLETKTLYEPMEDMSRGMQQKVAIARAFLSAPMLMLLDEPTTGLDPRSKREVQAFVQEIRATHDATVLLTTHDMDEAEALCDRIAVVEGGRLVALDTPAGLKRLVARNGQEATLEDVFMTLTGKRLVEDDQVN
ncbi:MAG: ABC transporter ATP-binding protein [Anaerolineae bacterium]